MSQLGTPERPARIAIIGAGPAGFYAAEALLKQKELTGATIDMFNHFPTPYGLVREGVAPDHQSIKSVTRVYERVADNLIVRYFGNVTFGVHLMHDDVAKYYDQIVYAVGAQSDRRMNIPGEDLAGSLPATAFVGWYNGHPSYVDLPVDLTHERVLVVGNGNVAMDVARILVTDPDELAKTDIADHALAALRESHVREVIMLGRRGPAQAAFTNVELREFGELADVDVIVSPEEMNLDPTSEASLAGNKVAAKNVEILRGYAAKSEFLASRRILMRFLVSPVEILPDANGRVGAVKLEHNRLVPNADGSLRSEGVGTFETLETGMILRSVGYRGVPLPDVPFEQRNGTIPNKEGRVLNPDGTPVAGEYVVGWAKRGPSGIIGTNKPDAVATVVNMIADLQTLPGIADDLRDPDGIVSLLEERQPDYVTYNDWKILDAHEIAKGAEQGRPRVKVVRVPEMLEIIRAGRHGEKPELS